MKKTLMLFLCLFVTAAAFAQQGSINGRLFDSSSRKLLPLATVTVFKAKDTALITYRLSNPEGEFKVPGLPLDIPLRILVTFSGYEAYRHDFTLTATTPSLRFDSIKLSATSKQLDEVVVIAERPPVSIKNDTLEFNANAFKTLPNALVEDLLKKLPGVQVDADGNIMVNGKPVNRILVDGKTFFGSDPKMATRNLPANIIDKVQVTDDKEELLRNGDDNINNVGKVVNITLKKGVKKGWFGKAYAGGGTEGHFETGAILNAFRDTLQVSLLGYANDLNKPGFGYSDLMQAGGLERSNSNLNSRSTSIWNSGSGSGISVNGINFGGAQNYGGIATSRGAGFNLNHAPNAKQSLFAQYFYGDVNIDRRNENNTQQFNSDTTVTNNSLLTGGVVTHAHNIGIGGKLKPDSVTNIIFGANYTIGLQNEDRFSDISSINNKLGPLSIGNINQNNKANTYYYRHNFTYNRLSKTKKGRRYTISHNLDINNRYNDNTTISTTKYLYPVTYDSLLNQLRDENIPRTDANVAFNYSEPLAKQWTARIGGRYEYSKLTNSINTFNPDQATYKYDVLNPALSSEFIRESNRFFITAGLEYKLKNVTITPSARYLLQDVNNNLASMKSSVRQKQNNLLPGLTVVYKQLTFNYSEDITLPFYTYLLPVADNTNPYYISRGNPDLRPTERHNVSLNYYMNNPKTNLNASIYVSGALANNDVVNYITVDQKGIQTSTPINTDGTKNAWANYNINKSYKSNPKFTYSWNIGAYYSYNRSRMFYNADASWQSTWLLNQWAGFSINLNDKFEWNNSGSYNYNFTSYTSKVFSPLDVRSYGFNSEAIVRMPKHVIWETSLNYWHNGNVPAGQQQNVVRWNAAINFTMLKDERGVLRISVYDILNNNAGINTSVYRNVINISRTNVLSRYVMATFTYNIRAIGSQKKKVGGDRLFLF
ncbi:MAG: outer membrane beta-barrel protein [Filimonas sp.]|nr:outer membrane beta-barrel protein [Filimonas sp.]